jgi:hypothetical protein
MGRSAGISAISFAEDPSTSASWRTPPDDGEGVTRATLICLTFCG